MSIQVIVYSVATGRVRRVVDPEVDVPSAIAYLGQVTITSGEARLLYTKQGAGLDSLATWQAAVNAYTGLNPDATQTDWCCGVDLNNGIQWWGTADLLCGDGLPGLLFVPAPWGTDGTWTFTPPSTFTPPVAIPLV